MQKNTNQNNDKSLTQNEVLSAEFHASFPKGKIGVEITKDMNENTLSIAYSPHVAFPCLEIARDESLTKEYTNLSNSIAIITNGTAVLGLGNIGVKASLPVMEGKSALFKMLSGINCFVMTIDDNDASKIAEIIKKTCAPFAAINLEDISAPLCFELCESLQDCPVPVFHDDQHGTAIVIYAAVLNYLDLIACTAIDKIKLVCMGAGAAAIASLNLLCRLGVKKENVWLFDSKGLVHLDRADIQNNKYKKPFAQKHDANLHDAMSDAKIFIGMSSGGQLDASSISLMTHDPLIMGLANPMPEIMPDVVASVRKDAIYCSGRSDFQNQVNNILCFPYLFRVVLDFNLTITEDLMITVAKSIAQIARDNPKYSRNRIIPKPLDPVVRYTMPAMIASNLNKNAHYNRAYIRHVNRQIGDLLIGAKYYMALDDNSFHDIKYAFDRIMHCWDLRVSDEMLHVMPKMLSMKHNPNRDILLLKHKDLMYFGASAETFAKASELGQRGNLLVSLCDFNSVGSCDIEILATYRVDTNKCYVKHDVDLDTVLFVSLLFVNEV